MHALGWFPFPPFPFPPQSFPWLPSPQRELHQASTPTYSETTSEKADDKLEEDEQGVETHNRTTYRTGKYTRLAGRCYNASVLEFPVFDPTVKDPN